MLLAFHPPLWSFGPSQWGLENELLNQAGGWGLLSLLWTPPHPPPSHPREAPGVTVWMVLWGQGLLPPPSSLCVEGSSMCLPFCLTTLIPSPPCPEGDGGQGLGRWRGVGSFWLLLSISASVTQSRWPIFCPPPSPVSFAEGAPPGGGARPADRAQVRGQPHALSAQ